MTDTYRLKSAIQNAGLKYYKVAEKLGLTRYGLKKKIENDSEFKASEIVILTKLLKLTKEDRDKIFFAS